MRYLRKYEIEKITKYLEMSVMDQMKSGTVE